VATQWAKPNGLWVVPAGKEAVTFAPLPIGALPGIGPVTQERLERVGIATLGDLAALPEEKLDVLFSRHGMALAARARGEDDAAVVPGSDAKSVGHETTFPADIADLEALRAVVWELAARVGYKLRQEGLLSRTITLKLRKGDFTTYTRSRTLPAGTAGDYAIARVAEDLLGQVHKPGMPVRLAGVRASGLLTAHEQRLLFEAAQQDRVRAYYATLDAIRDRFGFGAIGSGLTTVARTPQGDSREEGSAPEGSLFALSSKGSLHRVLKSQVSREEREQGHREKGRPSSRHLAPAGA
ncbi:MAG TPA: hypothetical protein VEI97_15230, partial [bacterium]|nr:hypothetical protein [bacterium]